MTIDEIIDSVVALGGVLVQRPGPGDGSPEISWGDVFFYYAPDGELPQAQPFGTIVTKDYPDDTASHLDQSGAFRVNIGIGAALFRDLIGRDPGQPASQDVDFSVPDALFPHPVYGQLAWVCVVNPAERTSSRVHELLRSAHADARRRLERRADAEVR